MNQESKPVFMLRTTKFKRTILKPEIAGAFFVCDKKRVKKCFGINSFVQDNHLLSHAAGTLRGFHFQAPPAAQGKLVRCGRGAIFEVAVDIRRGSPTYGLWERYELSAENGHQLYVPVGFAHDFATLEPDSTVVYKCADYCAPGTEGAVPWDSCVIDWPLTGDLILSDKDAITPPLAGSDSPFIYGENS